MKQSINKTIYLLVFLCGVLFIPLSVVKADTISAGQNTLDFGIESSIPLAPGDYVTIYGDLYDVYGQYNPTSGQAKASAPYLTGAEAQYPSVLVACNPVPPVSGNCTGSLTFPVPSAPGSYYLNVSVFDSNGDSGDGVAPFEVISVSKPDPTVEIFADKNNITAGGQVNISWISKDAVSCVCTYEDGSCGSSTGNGIQKNASNNPYTLQETKTFTVTCAN